MSIIILSGEAQKNKALSLDMITQEALRLCVAQINSIESYDNQAVNKLRQAVRQVQGFRYKRSSDESSTIRIRKPQLERKHD